MQNVSTILVFTIILALVFDLINGVHDAANSIATIVSTRVLRPHWAVVWAAFFNFIAFLFFDFKVATTIGKGIIDPSIVSTELIIAALGGAICWNLITWYFGLPSSSSHALIGGLIGPALVIKGPDVLNWAGLNKIFLSIIGSPLLGMTLGFIGMSIALKIIKNFDAQKVDQVSRKMQLFSAALYSLGHGGNDAQKTMGIITVLLVTNGTLSSVSEVPLWVVLSCHTAMGLGTMMGGWRIVKTMGLKLTELKPIGGFFAETSGAITLFLATHLGIPVSTTHTITGAIIGVGSARKGRSVRWNIATRVIWAWIFTIPFSSLVSAILFGIVRLVL